MNVNVVVSNVDLEMELMMCDVVFSGDIDGDDRGDDKFICGGVVGDILERVCGYVKIPVTVVMVMRSMR